jgi:hypothetical protein
MHFKRDLISSKKARDSSAGIDLVMSYLAIVVFPVLNYKALPISPYLEKFFYLSKRAMFSLN